MKKLTCFLLLFILFMPISSLALVYFDFEQPYFREPGVGVKDHSLIRVGSVYHLFYLRGNPAVNIGHATSTDLIHWNLEPPVLYVEPGTWDEYALWAPDVMRYSESSYFMYYTGVNNAGSQQIGLAISGDLYYWTKVPWPLYHPDPTWAEWSESRWCHGRDPFVFEHDGTFHMLSTAKTLNNSGAIASAISNDYINWQDNGPIYIHDSWHVIESVQCIFRNSIFHLFFTEEEVFGTSYMYSDSLYSGWDISTRTILDLGQAPEIDLIDGNWMFSRHTGYYDEYDVLNYIIRFDTLTWVGDTPTVYKPWPLSKKWYFIYGLAFAFQPTFGNNPLARGDTVNVGHMGDCWIGTYERYQGPLMYGSPGGAIGDGATGLIQSHSFIITGNSMNLLVGGGNYPDDCYAAMVDSATGEFLFKETGENTDAMTRRYWDLTSHKGKKVYIEIADKSTASFGHINVDDINESMDILNPPDPGEASKKTKSIPTQTTQHKGKKITEFVLHQNSPNPFNPTTNISYHLPFETRVTLDVYDVNGVFIRRLVNTTEAEGLHKISWDGRNSTGTTVSTGIYFYCLKAGGQIIDTKKMMLLK